MGDTVRGREMPRGCKVEVIDFKKIKGMQRSGVCCCMIAGDGESRIGRAIASVRDLAGEVIVVDTGTGGGTGAEARGAGARVIDLAWRDDFSEARNAALARAGTEWILVLDADEEIARSDHRVIRDCISHPGAPAYTFEQRTYCNEPTTFGWQPIPRDARMSGGARGFVACRQVRLFRRDERIRYRGRVFEEIESALQAHGLRTIDAAVTIHHYGRLEPRERIYRNALAYLASASRLPAVHRRNVHYAFETTVQLFVLGNLNEARGLITHCLEIVPDCWQFLNLRGLIDLRSGMTVNAIAWFQCALHVERNARELYCNLGAAYLENGEPAEALRSFLLGIERGGPDAGLLERAAVACREAGDIEGAFEYIGEALAADPYRPGARAVRAEILFARGDATEALRTLDTLRFLPDVPLRVYLRSLHLCIRMGAIDRAERIVGRAMDQHPGNEALLLLQGKILEMGGNDGGALAVYKRLLSVEPGNPLVLASLGCLHQRSGDLAAALAAFHRAHRLAPHDCRAEVNLAIVLEKLGRIDEAERHLRDAVSRRHDDGNACNALGCLLANRGLYGESIRYFERAVGLEPSNGRFHMNLHLANRKLVESTEVS